MIDKAITCCLHSNVAGSVCVFTGFDAADRTFTEAAAAGQAQDTRQHQNKTRSITSPKGILIKKNQLATVLYQY